MTKEFSLETLFYLTLEQIALGVLQSLRSLRKRLYFYQTFAPLHRQVREKLFADNHAITVLSGPFRGLRYLNEIVWGPITPKWLGSYEAELHFIVTKITKREYPRIIDVGCAEGYYAVGLAFTMPHSTVTAFDIDFISRRQLRKLAHLNDLSHRVIVRDYCHHSDLNTDLRERTLIICDIEGFEIELLNPKLGHDLQTADILVEVHESSIISQTVENTLELRFSASHLIQKINAVDRSTWIANAPAECSTLSPELLHQAVDEHRETGCRWLWMEAKPLPQQPPSIGTLAQKIPIE